MDATITAADFIDEMGVDTHIPYTDGGYANIGKVISDLDYLGISNVRDGITDGRGGSASLSSYVALAQAGIKFTIVGNDLDNPTPASIASAIGLIDRLNTAVPGSVVAVEGANEVNNWPVTYEGQTGLAGAVVLQQALYSAVHSDPALKGVSVDYFTGYDAGSVAVGPDPSKTPGLADFDTQHPYPNWGEAPAAWLATGQTLGNEPTPGTFVYTETGYTTNATQSNGVNQDVQAKYLLDLYFDAAADGASKTYVYQLMDAYAPGSPQGDDGFGLFNPDGTAKPAANAIHNLTTILADPGATAATFTPGPLPYAVSGLPSSGSSMAVAKSDGTFDIAVWNEPQIWDATTQSEAAAAPVEVTVQLGATYASVSVYDPMVGTSPVETVSDVSALQLAVTDHPLIVALGTPAATPTPDPAPVTPTAPDPVTTTASLSPGMTDASGGVSTASESGPGDAPVTVAAASSDPTEVSSPSDATVPSPTPIAASVVIHANGRSTVNVEGAGQTLTSTSDDTFLNHGLAGNTFVFEPGHGLDIISKFRAGGTDHDTIKLSSPVFASVADVLRQTRMDGGSAVITDPVSGDVVRLAGVSKAQLVHNKSDVTF